MRDRDECSIIPSNPVLLRVGPVHPSARQRLIQLEKALLSGSLHRVDHRFKFGGPCHGGPVGCGPDRYPTILAWIALFSSCLDINGVKGAPEFHSDRAQLERTDAASGGDNLPEADLPVYPIHFTMPSYTAPKPGARPGQPGGEPDISDEVEAQSASSGSDSESGSDSLDSTEPRKRRRTSPEPDAGLESDSDEDAEPAGGAQAMPSFSVPSRIKRGPTEKQKPGLPAKPGDQFHNPPAKVLAPTDPTTSFESLNLRPWLVRSLANMAIKRPTGIQKGCIPEILKGKDCIGGSRTGSGKTVAFAAPILQKWAEDPSGIFAVVLTPTR